MKDSLKQRLAMTTGAAAAAFGPAAVQGAVVFNDTSPITATFNAPSSFANWDVDGDGQVDFKLANQRDFRSTSSFIWTTTTSGASFPTATKYTATASASVLLQSYGAQGRGLVKASGGDDDFKALSAGVAVGPTLAGGYSWSPSGQNGRGIVFGSTRSSFASSAIGSAEMYGRLSAGIADFDFQGGAFGNNLIGFRFDIPGGSMHYGWAELFIDDGTGTGDRGDVTITEWAYEDTADCAITVGQTSGDNCASGSVPNPGTLLLLAAGAAGLRRWRGQAQAA